MRRFLQVDVFTAVPYLGNPLAVCLDGTGLDTAVMQRFTDWTNLSEATFLLPPTQSEADYRVRIFCPGQELPFAGHPTLGSCHAWLASGGRPQRSDGVIVQECQAGLVQLRRDGARLAFAAPPRLRQGPLAEHDVTRWAQALGIERRQVLAHAWCHNGPQWQGLLLDSAATVLRVRPDPALLRVAFFGIAGLHAPGSSDVQVEVSTFFPSHGAVAEDPVTGSFNAALGQWLIETGVVPPSYVAAQGTALGRAGRVHVERDAAGAVWVGGDSVTCIEGLVAL